MIRRPTVVYIIVLLAVAGLYLFLNNRDQAEELSPTPEATSQISYLFSAEEGIPTGIRVTATSGQTLGLERNAENAWSVTVPVEAAAEQGASEAAASQIMTMRILERIPQIDPGVVGLQEPEYFLTVRFNTGKKRTVQIGVVTPTDSGYYVQDASGGDVWIVSKSSVEALLRLLAAPPYQATPAPDPALSPTGPAPPTP